MYCALADTEFLCRFAHGGAVFDDVGGQLAGALLDVTFQDPTRSLSRYTGVYAGGVWEMMRNMGYNVSLTLEIFKDIGVDFPLQI